LRALPDELDVETVIASLRDGWSIDVERAEYAPIGGGSYHWIVTGRDGTRHFATVDDLDRKPWLGSTRDSAFAGLREAFDASAALRDDGLEFVLAPIRAAGGGTLVRVAPRYSLAVFPFVVGRSGTFGQYDDDERAAILELLARLHRAKAKVRPLDLELPGRRDLEDALLALGRPWAGGPLAEPARESLAAHGAVVSELLAHYDRLAAGLPGRSDWVLTHGEPHAGNVIRTGERYVLVDWDTVALAPAERDLWMLGDDADGGFFRLRWDLEDLAAFTKVLRSPHGENADTQKALDGISIILGRAR
jgi:spectinomycin phosphotransferase